MIGQEVYFFSTESNVLFWDYRLLTVSIHLSTSEPASSLTSCYLLTASNCAMRHAGFWRPSSRSGSPLRVKSAVGGMSAAEVMRCTISMTAAANASRAASMVRHVPLGLFP